jgi:hypothetical protein
MLNIFKTFSSQDYYFTINNCNEEYWAFHNLLWSDFFKLRLDKAPVQPKAANTFFQEEYEKFEWFKIYDFIEFIAKIDHPELQFDRKLFMERCNLVLERENSGYRFVNSIIAPIVNQSEINEMEFAIHQTMQFTGLKGANIHLTSALEKLSDRKNPDYRNSIKESISAVESVAKKISGKDKDSLGPALQKIKGKIKIHQALERGFLQIYGYASDGDGIRHGLMGESSCDFEDAKFMLVSCSAFINYLIVKAQKVGIVLS